MRTKGVRLNRFRLLAYRSCRDTQFAITEGVTALIGPNGSGKTNLLHGLLLLDLGRRRGARSTDNTYTRECSLEADFSVDNMPVQLRAAITYRPTEQNTDQIVNADEHWNFKAIDGKSRWIRTQDLVPFPSTMRYLPDGVSWYHYEQAMSRIYREHRVGRRSFSKKITGVYGKIQQFRASISYYSASQFTNPSLCPTSIEIDQQGKLVQDINFQRQLLHTSFIYDLYKLSKDSKSTYEQFVSLVDERGVGLIRAINWRSVKLSSQAYEVRAGGRVTSKKATRTMIIPTVHVGSSQLSFNQLSEGTLRTMAMLFYVVTDKSELLLLEEPEVCVHHGLLSSVIQIIREYGRTKQIIFSTHSEAVVDALKPEQVLIVDRQKNKGTTVGRISERMSPSGFAALKKYLATAGNLGEYWRHSGF